MRLIKAEWSRLFARRFTRIMIVAVFGVLGLVGTAIALTSHQHNAATLAAAQAKAQQIRTENEAARQRCIAAHANPGSSSPEFPAGMNCDDLTSYQPSVDDLEPHQFFFRHDATDLLIVLGAVLALFAYAVGASFLGAEWTSGGLTNLLLWRPRRVPLLLGKLGTLLLGVLTVTAAFSAAWVGALYGIARWRGDASRITPGLLRSLGLTDLRVLALALAAAALGFAIASLGRHTATALGIAVGYAVVFEIGGRIVLQLMQVARPERFLLSNYVGAWLTKALPFYVNPPTCQPGPSGCDAVRWYVHMNQGAVVGGVILFVVLIAAVYSFRRRDVT